MIKRIPFQDITKKCQNEENIQKTIKQNILNQKSKTQVQKSNFNKPSTLPQGNNYYSRGKQAEYSQKHLPLAEQLYRKAIEQDDRKESAIKDLATVLHQQGKTEEACQLLMDYKDQYTGDLEKYDNLLKNLQKQINPSGKCYNKYILINGLPQETQQATILDLFNNPSRIQSIEYYHDYSFFFTSPTSTSTSMTCLVKFESYSKAKKTLETFNKLKLKQYPDINLYWVNIFGKINSKIILSQNLYEKNYKDDKKSYLNPYCVSQIWNEVFMMHHSEDCEKPNISNKMEWGSEIQQFNYQLNCQILDRENREFIQIQDIDIEKYVDSLLE